MLRVDSMLTLRVDGTLTLRVDGTLLDLIEPLFYGDTYFDTAKVAKLVFRIILLLIKNLSMFEKSIKIWHYKQ